LIPPSFCCPSSPLHISGASALVQLGPFPNAPCRSYSIKHLNPPSSSPSLASCQCLSTASIPLFLPPFLLRSMPRAPCLAVLHGAWLSPAPCRATCAGSPRSRCFAAWRCGRRWAAVAVGGRSDDVGARWGARDPCGATATRRARYEQEDDERRRGRRAQGIADEALTAHRRLRLRRRRRRRHSTLKHVVFGAEGTVGHHGRLGTTWRLQRQNSGRTSSGRQRPNGRTRRRRRTRLRCSRACVSGNEQTATSRPLNTATCGDESAYGTQ